MLLRLAYLGLMNTFALLRLLPRSDHNKDVEILALRHQITLLHRQLDDTRIRFTPTDRAFLAALLHRLPRQTLRSLRLLDCWCVRTRSCAGTATCSLAATQCPAPNTQAAPAPCAPSESSSCGWLGRTPAGATAASTVSSSSGA